MAIKAMEVYGSMITGLSSKLVEACSESEVYEAWGRGLTPVLMPYRIVRKLDFLPESWAVTSDSIAVALAWLLGCDYAFISKVVDGLTVNGKLVRRVRVSMDYPIQGVIDNYAINLAGRLGVRVVVFNAYKPWVVGSVLKGYSSCCTVISG